MRIYLVLLALTSRGSGTNNTVHANTVAVLASALARFGTNLTPLSDDILRNVVTAALQTRRVIAGYFHAAGRRMKLPWVPTGIASGSWHLAGRSRGKEMWECESMEMVGWWNEKMVE